MTPNEIIRGLKEEPEKWGRHRDCVCKAQGLDEFCVTDLGVRFFNHGSMAIYRATNFIDRLRLRFAIWRWKRWVVRTSMPLPKENRL